MTVKIMTIRVPGALYTKLCRDAGECGISVSAHARRLIEREHEVDGLDELRREIICRLDGLEGPGSSCTSEQELLLLCRGIAAHLNPQLAGQIRAKLNLLNTNN